MRRFTSGIVREPLGELVTELLQIGLRIDILVGGAPEVETIQSFHQQVTDSSYLEPSKQVRIAKLTPMRCRPGSR
jgi:hypothetical protein